MNEHTGLGSFTIMGTRLPERFTWTLRSVTHTWAMDGSAPIITLKHRGIAQPLESLGVPRTSQLFSLDATAAGVWPQGVTKPTN